MSRTIVQGKVLDKRTAAMVRELERRLGHPLLLAQGSYTGGAVAASADTHNGGGAVDFRLVGMSTKQILQLVREARVVGFAAWFRPEVPGLWGRHVHAIAIGCPDLSRGARAQVAAFRNGRDGLRGNRRDPQHQLGIAPTTFEAYLAGQKGKATVGHVATIGRWAPSLSARQRAGTQRAQDYVITYTGMVWADEELWLKTRLKTYYLARRTDRA